MTDTATTTSQRNGPDLSTDDAQGAPALDDEIHFFDILLLLLKHKKALLIVPFVAGILGVVYSLSLPNIYTATTKIVPPQQNQSSPAAMLAQVGALTGAASAAKNPNELYVGMLRSRTVADGLIKRFDLVNAYGVGYFSDARRRLSGATAITAGKDGIITIDVDDRDPGRAAEIANAYVDELLQLTQVLAVTEASQRRLFLERQLRQAGENLSRAESEARAGLDRRGLVKVDDQGRAIVETAARLRGQITAQEIQIRAMQTFAAEANPNLLRAKQELAAMQIELERIEGGGSATARGPRPEGMESLRLLRDVKYYETVYELLAKQYEIAKVDEARESAVIQVLDSAIQPERRSKPNRTLIVLTWALLAAVATFFFILAWESFMRGDGRGNALRRQLLRRYLAWR